MNEVHARPASPGRVAAVAAALCALLVLAGCGSSNDKNDNNKPSKPAQPSAKKNRSSKVPKAPNATSAKKRATSPKVLNALAPVKRPGGNGPGKQIAGINDLPTDKAVETLSGDVGKFWQDGFNRAGYQLDPATENFVTTQVDTACGSLSTDDAPGYCPKDNSLNWTLGWIDSKATPLGSFPVGWVVATTWGYRIEFQLGLEKKLDGNQLDATASCLAGLWAASIYRRGALEQNDIQQGAKLVQELHPDQAGFQAIAGAFDKGFNSGKGGNCL